MFFDNVAENTIVSMQANALCHHYDPTFVVQEFVYRYYETLSEAPHDAWRCYTISAQYMHVDGEVLVMGDRNLKSAVGQHQIHLNIVFQQFTECTFRVRSMNVQHSSSAQYMVLVTGDIIRDQNPPVMFIQSFLIECIQEINQYAISNSILKVYIAT